MTLNQIKQVGITYTSQRQLWWGLAAVGLFVIPNLIALLDGPRSETSPWLVFWVGMPILAFFPFLVGLAKSQFGHPRARLLPNFSPAHVAVLGALLALALVVVPLAVAGLVGLNVLGLFALTFAIGAPTVWGAQLNRFVPFLIALAALYSLLTPWGQHFWVSDASQYEAVHLAIVVAGTLLVIAWVWRLCYLREEMDDYQNVYQVMLARRTGSEAIEQRRVVAAQIGRSKLVSAVGDWWHERLGGYFGGSKLRLIRLLRYGFGANPIELQGLIMLAMFLSIALFLGRFMGAGVATNFGAVWLFAMFGILLPGHIAGEMLAQRRPRLAYEMLLPLSREQLVDGLRAAAARNSITLWLIMNVGFAALAVVQDAEVRPSIAATALLVSAAILFLAMSLSLRISVWPSLMKRLVVVWVCWMVLIFPLAGLWLVREKTGLAPLILLCGLLVVIGRWLWRSGRRAWLNVELG